MTPPPSQLCYPGGACFDERGFLSEISRPLRRELLLHRIGPVLRPVLIALSVDEKSEAPLAMAIVENLERQVYVAGDLIVEAGRSNASLHFVAAGKLEVLVDLSTLPAAASAQASRSDGSSGEGTWSKRDPTKTTQQVSLLAAGDVFGESSLLKQGMQATATIRVSTPRIRTCAAAALPCVELNSSLETQVTVGAERARVCTPTRQVVTYCESYVLTLDGFGAICAEWVPRLAFTCLSPASLALLRLVEPLSESDVLAHHCRRFPTFKNLMQRLAISRAMKNNKSAREALMMRSPTMQRMLTRSATRRISHLQKRGNRVIMAAAAQSQLSSMVASDSSGAQEGSGSPAGSAEGSGCAGIALARSATARLAGSFRRSGTHSRVEVECASAPTPAAA